MGRIRLWRSEHQGATGMAGAIEEEQGTRREKSTVQERDVVDEGLYLCCRRAGPCEQGRSGAALYPIGMGAKPGGRDNIFYFILLTIYFIVNSLLIFQYLFINYLFINYLFII